MFRNKRTNIFKNVKKKYVFFCLPTRGEMWTYPLLLHFLLASQLHEAFLKILPYSCVIAVPQKARLWRRNPWGGCKKNSS